MKFYHWNDEKNNQLKRDRGICFEDIVFFLEQNSLLDSFDNPNQGKYPGQKLYLIDIDGYAYIVPFVESADSVFLKTIIPSRKATKKYLRKKD